MGVFLAHGGSMSAPGYGRQVPGMLLSGQQHAVQVRARLASGASTSPEDLTISLALGQPGEAFHVMTPVQR